MRDLLSRRQDEQLQKRTASGELPKLASTHGQLRELRRELNALVSATHHKSGKPHGWIHNELRRRCGGPPVAAACPTSAAYSESTFTSAERCCVARDQTPTNSARNSTDSSGASQGRAAFIAQLLLIAKLFT